MNADASGRHTDLEASVGPSVDTDRPQGSRPMRMLWYWPHPGRGDSDLAAAALAEGDTLTVECLATFRGEPLTDGAERYEVVRDLPDVSRDGLGPARRIVDRVLVHGRRAWRRDALVRARRFDLLYIQTSTLLDALTIRRLARRLPVVVAVHDVRPHQSRLPARVERALLRHIYLAATSLVVYHEELRNRLVTEFGADPTRVAIVAPALSVNLSEQRHPSDEGGPPRRVIFFGSLRPNKGVEVLLDAIDRLPLNAIELTIAGAGEPEIEAMVEAIRTRPDVHLEIGFVDTARRTELYRSNDIVVLPYLASFTSQSGVLVDAYSYGLPVVASDVGAIGPTIRADGSGWLVPPGDARALAETLVAATSDRDAYRTMAANTRAAAIRHDPIEVGRAFRAVFADAVSRHDIAGPSSRRSRARR